MLRVTSEVANQKEHSKAQKPRSSRRKCSVKIGVFKSFASFTGKHLLKSLFNKVANLRPYKETSPQVFSCEICEIFRNTYLKNICGRLLLKKLLCWRCLKFEIGLL